MSMVMRGGCSVDSWAVFPEEVHRWPGDNGVVTAQEAKALVIWNLTWPLMQAGMVDWPASRGSLERVFGVLAAA